MNRSRTQRPPVARLPCVDAEQEGPEHDQQHQGESAGDPGPGDRDERGARRTAWHGGEPPSGWWQKRRDVAALRRRPDRCPGPRGEHHPVACPGQRVHAARGGPGVAAGARGRSSGAGDAGGGRNGGSAGGRNGGSDGCRSGSSTPNVRTGPGVVVGPSKRTVTSPLPDPHTQPAPCSRCDTSCPGRQLRAGSAGGGGTARMPASLCCIPSTGSSCCRGGARGGRWAGSSPGAPLRAPGPASTARGPRGCRLRRGRPPPGRRTGRPGRSPTARTPRARAAAPRR